MNVPTPSDYSEDTVRRWPLDGARAQLLEDIVATPTLSRPHPDGADTVRGRRRWVVPVAAAAAVVLVVGVVFAWLQSDLGSDPGTSRFADSAVAAAEDNPLRVLVGEPGWHITHADGFGTTSSELTFTNGDHELDVFWRPAEQYDSYYEDRAHDMTATPIDLLGSTSSMFTYGPGEYTTLRPVEGDTFLEVRGGVGGERRYRAVLASLRTVDVATWLAAMPAEVVLPDDRLEAVQEMLEGVPLPPGFSAASIEADDLSDRYHLGADVSGAVACAWIQQWRQASAAGDEPEVDRAADALRSSHDWAVLHEMEKGGDYPDVLWEIADEVASGHLPREYRQGLGCSEELTAVP